MKTGGCYCGAVRYRLEGELGPLVNCHCRSCRRAHGAAFVTTALVHSGDLEITRGTVRDVRSGQGIRSLCGECGGRLYNRPASNPGITMLVPATLDDEPTRGAVMHVNVESKAPWYEIADDLPRFPGLPPRADAELERR